MPDSASNLYEAIAQLDSSQAGVVNWAGGPLLVYAPLPGQTMVLALSIARRLVSAHDRNSHVLVLTRNNLVAEELISRVERYLPGTGARVFAGTFQSLCVEILRQHGSHLGIAPNFKIYSSEADLQAVMEAAAPELDEAERSRTRSLIRHAKQRLLKPDTPPPWLMRKSRLGAQQYWSVYHAYERVLREHNALDPDSVLMSAHALLTQYPSIAYSVRIIYPHVFVTEVQAMTHAEHEILKSLVRPGDQELTMFASGWLRVERSERILERLLDYFRPAIRELNSYCPPAILELANLLMAHGGGWSRPWPESLSRTPRQTEPGEYRLRRFENGADEAWGIAREIAARLEQTAPSSIGVAARGPGILQQLSKALNGMRIPTGRVSGRAQFLTPPFVWLEAVLRLSAERRSMRHLRTATEAFHAFTGIDIDLSQVALTGDAVLGGDYLKSWLEVTSRRKAKPDIRPLLRSLRQHLIEAEDPVAFVREALDELRSRVVDGPEYADELRIWDRVLQRSDGSRHLSSLLLALDRTLRVQSTEPVPVLLLTIGQGAGLTFQHLYIMGMAQGIFPSAHPPLYVGNQRHLEQERRRLLAMMMRVQQSLTFSFAHQYENRHYEPSIFLQQMRL